MSDWTRHGYRPAQPLWSVSREAEDRIDTATKSDSGHWKDTVLSDVTFGDDACFFLRSRQPGCSGVQSK